MEGFNVENADNSAKKQRIIGRPFKPGQSGNPKGRPKGSFSITTLVRQALEKRPKGEREKTFVDKFVQKLLDKAIDDGDTVTQKMIWNYIDGLPRETIDMNVTLPKPILDINALQSNKSDKENSEIDKED